MTLFCELLLMLALPHSNSYSTTSMSLLQAALPATIGLALLYIAGSWLVMHGVGSYVKARRDLYHWKRQYAAMMPPVYMVSL